jgi:DNA mismatch endonuclease, patch repair protein
MAQVRSQRNRSTEWKLRAALVQAGLRGWIMNPGDVPGKPDFAFSAQRVAVFVDGCFWHGCPICKRTPSSNIDYWHRKITRNRTRDATVDTNLKESGWNVLRIWEHELKCLDSVVARIENAVKPKTLAATQT